MELIDKYNHFKTRKTRKIVFVAVAGMSNALGGMLAANTEFPVISCPPITDKMTLFMDIWSSLRNPSNVPAAVVLSPTNVALFAKRIMNDLF